MSKEHQARFIRGGGMLQSAIPKKPLPQANLLSSQGLLLRGVVLVTYVLNDPDHPFIDSEQPVAVYCDVLVYSNVAGMRDRYIRQALVIQDRGSLHSGRIWKPRATTKNISGNLDPDNGTNPADMDGDHVLVGFLHNQLFEPIVLAGLPHPNADVGQEDEEAGHRLRLKVADGDPDFWKHKGAFYGISDDGDFVVDLTQAHKADLGADGKQPAPPGGGNAGNFVAVVPTDSKMKLGSKTPGDKASLDSKIQTELDRIKTEIKALTDKYNPHTHTGSTTTGTIGPSAAPGVLTIQPPNDAPAPASPGATDSVIVELD